MSEAFERMRDVLTTHGARITDNRQDHFMAQCPHHEDHNPSLGVDDRGDKVIIHCHAGCHTDDVVKDLGLGLADLFDGDLTPDRTNSLTGQLVRSYLYEQANGDPWFYVDRYYPKVFRQRLPTVEPVRDLSDREAARRLGLKGRNPILYHYPRVRRAIGKGGTTVWFLDGEKDVETAERLGLVATCPPGFRKWDPRYAEGLKGAAEVVLVVDQDKEKPDGTLGAGQANAVTARMGFRAVGIPVRVLAPAAGKDFTDHVDAGFGTDDFVHEPSLFIRPRGLKADDLANQHFEPLNWAVHNLIPAGLTILAGPPKKGKTWMALDMSCAVASGGPCMSMLDTVQGSVLHLAREDGYRRLQSRLRAIMVGQQPPRALELVPSEVDWQGGEEGLAHMTEWAEEVRNPRLVVIDTLAKLEPEMGETRTGGAYTGNYRMMSKYKEWGDLHNCAVVVIHHDHKGKVDKDTDPFTRISGTRALTGAADTLLFLDPEQGTREGTLHVTGRDVEEEALRIVKMGPLWRVTEPL